MIIPDVNLLLYAYFRAYPQHEAARAWWEATLSGTEPVGLTDVTLVGFLRISTHRRVFPIPMSVDVAASTIESWLATPVASFLVPDPRQLTLALGLARSLGTAGHLTTDIQIASYALKVGGVVATADADFARFPGVRWKNPLESRV